MICGRQWDRILSKTFSFLLSISFHYCSMGTRIIWTCGQLQFHRQVTLSQQQLLYTCVQPSLKTRFVIKCSHFCWNPQHKMISSCQFKMNLTNEVCKIILGCLLWLTQTSKPFSCYRGALTCLTVAIKASRDFLGGRQNFLPCSWQHRFGKQSIGVLQGLGKRSKSIGGGGVHCR